MLVAADLWLGPTWEIVVAGEPSQVAATRRVLAALHQAFIPRRVIACRGHASGTARSAALDPLFAGKTPNGRTSRPRTSARDSPARHPCMASTTSWPVAAAAERNLAGGWPGPEPRLIRIRYRCPGFQLPSSCAPAGHFAAVADERVTHDFVFHVPGQLALGNHVEQELRHVVGEHLAGVQRNLGRQVGRSEDHHAVPHHALIRLDSVRNCRRVPPPDPRSRCRPPSPRRPWRSPTAATVVPESRPW